MRVSQLAALVDSPFEGDGTREIVRAAPLEQAGPDEIAFVGNAKAARAAAASNAGCLIVPSDYSGVPARTLIRAPEPRAAFSRIITALHPDPNAGMGVHPTAILHPTARLAPDVAVGAYCTIGADVVIGEGSRLYNNVTVYHNVQIGPRAIIHSGTVIGADGFGFTFANGRYEKFPQVGRVEIGTDVEIGANSTIDRGALGATRIGDGVKLDNMVHVGHHVTIGNHVVIAAQTGISGGVVIEDYAVIAGQVGIADNVRVEARAVLGAKCGVPSNKIIRSGETVWGIPARPIKDYLEQLAHLGYLGELRKEVAELRRLLGRLPEERT